ncbi:MAG TPA: hypothetical protein VF079_06550 [Sphingomicrobium sp.]
MLLVYLAILALAGLLALAMVARGLFRKICRKKSADPKGTGSDGHPGKGPVYVPPTIYKRPDPLIYSQSWLIARGLAVTWDNPDISLFEVKPGGPAPAQAHALEPGRPHLIRARVWNGSFEAPAVNLLVRFFYLTFGIGTVKTFIGETLVDLPVKGAPGLPIVAEVPWTTPAAAGHYCVQVELIWPDDADPGNNLGQTNLDVKQLNSPNASFVFQLRNDGVATAPLRLAADAYRLPPLDPCEREPDQRHRNERLAKHLRDAHGVPPGWRVEIGEQAGAPLRPGEQREVAVKVVAADGFDGELDINVNAFDGERLVGGVTLRVHS